MNISSITSQAFRHLTVHKILVPTNSLVSLIEAFMLWIAVNNIHFVFGGAPIMMHTFSESCIGAVSVSLPRPRLSLSVYTIIPATFPSEQSSSLCYFLFLHTSCYFGNFLPVSRAKAPSEPASSGCSLSLFSEGLVQVGAWISSISIGQTSLYTDPWNSNTI